MAFSGARICRRCQCAVAPRTALRRAGLQRAPVAKHRPARVVAAQSRRCRSGWYRATGCIEQQNLKTKNRKEVSRMQKKFEAPELTLIGQADELVMGSGFGGDDYPQQLAPDFEFEQDSL